MQEKKKPEQQMLFWSFGPSVEIRLHFCAWQKLLCCRHQAGGKQVSPGHLLCIFRISYEKENAGTALSRSCILVRVSRFELEAS